MTQMRDTRPPDVFANGAAYEPYVGRWSRLVAEPFLDGLSAPANARWLDVGCGTGALSQTLLRRASPRSAVGLDRSQGFATYARAHPRYARLSFGVADALALPLPAASFDVTVSGLMLNFIPQPGQALAEMMRVTRPGGLVAVYVWDYAGRMEFLRLFWDAAVELDAQASELDEGRRFPLCHPEALQALFESAGAGSVRTYGIEIATRFKDFDDFWLPFTGGQGSAPSYLMHLSESQRVALRERVRSKLPFAADSSISLVARAWAVCGTR